MTRLTTTVLFCAALCFAITSAQNKTSSTKKEYGTKRIVGGTDARRRDFPSLVSIQNLYGAHYCGGTIISDSWVLTAAHCFVGKTPADTRVVAGLLILGETHQDIQMLGVYQMIMHPYFPGGTDPAPNDIGLLRLSGSFLWTYAVLPATLPYPGQEFTGYAWTAGWGYVNSQQAQLSPALQRVQMYIISLQQCANDLYNFMGTIGPLNQNMICTRGANTATESTCNGDSGGMLMQNSRVIGVSSFTLTPCGVQYVPSVFTKVSSYIDFIGYYVPLTSV